MTCVSNFYHLNGRHSLSRLIYRPRLHFLFLFFKSRLYSWKVYAYSGERLMAKTYLPEVILRCHTSNNSNTFPEYQVSWVKTHQLPGATKTHNSLAEGNTGGSRGNQTRCLLRGQSFSAWLVCKLYLTNWNLIFKVYRFKGLQKHPRPYYQPQFAIF